MITQQRGSCGTGIDHLDQIAPGPSLLRFGELDSYRLVRHGAVHEHDPPISESSDGLATGRHPFGPDLFDVVDGRPLSRAL